MLRQTSCRAAIVDALQKVGMRHRPRRQAWACSVLLNTGGSDLTLLKALLDDGPDYHTTFKLVSVDLQVGNFTFLVPAA